MQSAVRFDPPAHAFGISRPQDAVALGGDRLIAFHVPGAVKYEASARSDANAASRSDSQQHGTCRRAGAVDFDAFAGGPQRPIFCEVGTDLSPGVVCDPHRRSCWRRSQHQQHRGQHCVRLHQFFALRITEMCREDYDRTEFITSRFEAHAASSRRASLESSGRRIFARSRSDCH
jgi:hypothetical protein